MSMPTPKSKPSSTRKPRNSTATTTNQNCCNAVGFMPKNLLT
ncbi:Uncharacterised protein [Mycobacteroides abscessus subsp. abscessus]|nr:Uncharacterised protein [Mycobacteroides abscessus subsp. abscessus]